MDYESMTSRILFVDQAESFGGSMIVAGLLITQVKDHGYEAYVAAPFQGAFIRRVFHNAERVYRVRKLLPYPTVERIRSRIGTHAPRFVGRLLQHCVSFCDLISGALYAVRLAAIIVVKRISLVHTNNSYEAIWAAKLTRRKVVAHLHGVTINKPHIVNRSDAIVAVSKCVIVAAERAGLDPAKLSVIPNGVCIEDSKSSETHIRSNLGVSATAKLVVLAGRIVPWKGQRQFLEAAVAVLREMEDVYFVLVGDVADGSRDYSDGLVEFATSAAIERHVKWTGYVDDVNGYLRAANVVVHASIEPEPFGLAIVEAMAVGKPVVASCLGAGPEIVSDGVDGLIVDPRNPALLAEAILRLLRDPKFADRLSANAKSTVAKRFSAVAMGDGFARLYDGLTRMG